MHIYDIAEYETHALAIHQEFLLMGSGTGTRTNTLQLIFNIIFVSNKMTGGQQ